MINQSIKFFTIFLLAFSVFAGGDDRDEEYYENLDQELNTRYQFIKAKLFGYTEEDFKILENKLNNESLKYGKAIMLSNKG